jgi:hypothetical protein
VVHLSEGGVESITDLLALQGARRSIDGDFRNNLGNIEGALGVLESGGGLNEVIDLIGNQADIGAKRLRSEAELDKLQGANLVSFRHVKFSIGGGLPVLTFFCSINLELGQS